MSWQNEMVLIVRHLIDDIDASTYTNSRLEQSILIGAVFVKDDVDFGTTYTIDTDETVLSPDPTSPRDDSFINLVCLKTASIILKAEAKVKANESVSIADGPSRIDTTSRWKAYKELADDMSKNYEQAKLEYMTGAGSPGKAIVGPITEASIETTRGNI